MIPWWILKNFLNFFSKQKMKRKTKPCLYAVKLSLLCWCSSLNCNAHNVNLRKIKAKLHLKKNYSLKKIKIKKSSQPFEAEQRHLSVLYAVNTLNKKSTAVSSWLVRPGLSKLSWLESNVMRRFHTHFKFVFVFVHKCSDVVFGETSSSCFES